MIDTREIQMGLLKQRSQDIDVQIRKHQARLHVVESKYSETEDEKFLVEVCKANDDSTLYSIHSSLVTSDCGED